MANSTMEKFGYPRSLVAEIGVWSVLVRPKQATLGALVLVCREEATAFSALSPEAFADLGQAVAAVEATLKPFTQYERINYLMLMMVDPDVHFHVIPRYDGARRFGDLEIADAGWPGPPELGAGPALDDAGLDALTAEIKSRWVFA